MRYNKKHTLNDRLRRSLLIGGSASVLVTLFSPSLIAAEVRSAIENKTEEEQIEVIEVSGVRNSLESALLTKRDANSIVDAISATDMDALPALDLGEALQAIPGIQLNTEDGSRNSEINLRGLAGGYVKVTAEGQSFSTPSRSSGFVGSANPFGSFEASFILYENLTFNIVGLPKFLGNSAYGFTSELSCKLLTEGIVFGLFEFNSFRQPS